jgi:hypothetical protein
VHGKTTVKVAGFGEKIRAKPQIPLRNFVKSFIHPQVLPFRFSKQKLVETIKRIRRLSQSAADAITYRFVLHMLTF